MRSTPVRLQGRVVDGCPSLAAVRQVARQRVSSLVFQPDAQRVLALAVRRDGESYEVSIRSGPTTHTATDPSCRVAVDTALTSALAELRPDELDVRPALWPGDTAGEPTALLTVHDDAPPVCSLPRHREPVTPKPNGSVNPVWIGGAFLEFEAATLVGPGLTPGGNFFGELRHVGLGWSPTLRVGVGVNSGPGQGEVLGFRRYAAMGEVCPAKFGSLSVQVLPCVRVAVGPHEAEREGQLHQRSHGPWISSAALARLRLHVGSFVFGAHGGGEFSLLSTRFLASDGTETYDPPPVGVLFGLTVGITIDTSRPFLPMN